MPKTTKKAEPYTRYEAGYRFVFEIDPNNKDMFSVKAYWRDQSEPCLDWGYPFMGAKKSMAQNATLWMDQIVMQADGERGNMLSSENAEPEIGMKIVLQEPWEGAREFRILWVDRPGDSLIVVEKNYGKSHIWTFRQFRELLLKSTEWEFCSDFQPAWIHPDHLR